MAARSGCGLAMPSSANEGKRRERLLFTIGGGDSDGSAAGRAAAAKWTLRSGRQSGSGEGRFRRLGGPGGSGKGCAMLESERNGYVVRDVVGASPW